jgi:hypothetical protein
MKQVFCSFAIEILILSTFYGYIANIYAVGSIGYVPLRNEPNEFWTTKSGR